MTTSLLTSDNNTAMEDVIPKSGKWRPVLAAVTGNALEWYDFTVYALFAIYIAHNFFPSDSVSGELIKAFLGYGLGFVIRPLGAVLIGVYADRVGRKAALTLTIMLMALGTLVIGIAPTYAAIGIGAPILLVAGRMLQGFSAGGEVGGAVAFLVEHAPRAEKGKYASWLQASMAMSNILGALVAFAVTSWLSVDQINGWGWRIPFLLGLLIAPVGLWIRSTIDETPDFKEQSKTQRIEKTPFLAVFRDAPLELLKGTGMSILWVTTTSALVVFMPVYVQKAFHVSASNAFTAALIGNILMVIVCVAAGTLSDKVGRRTMLTVGALLLAVGVHPLLSAIQSSPTLGTAIVVQSSFCIMTGLFVGVAPSALSEIFPTRIRATGVSLSYTIAVTIFGGFAPAVLVWLAQNGSPTAPAWYVTAAAMASLIAIPTLKPAKD